MFYYCYPGLWEAFFHALGMEVVVSPVTSLKTIERASLISESEHCLPMKLLDAHVDALVGRVDAVLVPRVISMLEKHVACAKLAFLPDAVHSHVRGRTKVITLDLNQDREPLHRSLCRMGCELGVTQTAAAEAAHQAIAEMHNRLARLAAPPASGGRAPVLLMSHPYILHDDYICGPVVRKLGELSLQSRFVSFAAHDAPRSFVAWDTCSKMLHALDVLHTGEVSGVIQISSFNCGCDSMTIEFFRDILRRKKIPFMVLMMDEHSAPAGIETRLEAFVDSMTW